ncbi:MAG: hypothetical protein ACXWKG_09440, partial [Limisphaerales bacterium]
MRRTCTDLSAVRSSLPNPSASAQQVLEATNLAEAVQWIDLSLGPPSIAVASTSPTARRAT